MSNLVNSDELERRLSAAMIRANEAFANYVAAQDEVQALETIKASLVVLEDSEQVENSDAGDTVERFDLDPALVQRGQETIDRYLRNRGSNVFATHRNSGKFVGARVEAPVSRVHSTQMVSDIVREAGHAVDVEEVLSSFESRYGIPDGWANPRNAVNTALHRAASKGLISTVTGGLFAPPILTDDSALELIEGANA